MTVTHIWERLNPKWLVAGVTSGLLAGFLVLLVGMVLSHLYLGEWSQALKILGGICFGYEATAYGPVGLAGLAGAGIHFFFSGLYGVTYAQLVHEHSSSQALLVLALVTSIIIWVFGGMLFMPTFNPVMADFVSRSLILFFHLLFGLSFGLIINSLRPKFLG